MCCLSFLRKEAYRVSEKEIAFSFRFLPVFPGNEDPFLLYEGR